MEQRILRFGIIGAGRIATRFCDAVKHVQGAAVTAVASTSAERAAAFAAANGVAAAYGSYEAMLTTADIDAVYIATTHNFHMANIRLCLQHRKHVLCEKPMVLTAADAEEAFRLAAEKGCFLMEAMWSCFLPQYQKAKEWVESGRIGTPVSAQVALGFRCDPDPNGRLLNPALAGGALYDIGVYAIEPLRYLVGEPIQEVIGCWHPHAVTGVDERATAILRFPSCDAVLQCSIGEAFKEFSILCGREGYIESPSVIGGHTVRLFDRDRNLVEEFHAPWENGFEFQIEEVLRCVAAGKLTSDVMTPAITVEAARAYETILK